MASGGVNVSVEVLDEYKISEFAPDGSEVTIPPPTLSETLARCAARIDFSKKSVEDEEKLTELESKDVKQLPAWPWDNVRNKLNDALTELSVLSDVLTIAKEKQYVILDPVPEEEDDTKLIITLYYRKKSCCSASTLILNATEQSNRLRNFGAEQRSRNVNDYYIELLRLRQNWRLRKSGEHILGDLTYRTTGSLSDENGTFRVVKADEPDDDDNIPSGSNKPQIISAIRVIVPKELQGVAYIKVTTQKDQEDLCTAVTNLIGRRPNLTHLEGDWQKKLEFAQNVLFCKELFKKISDEAMKSTAPLPHVVLGNQIRCTLLPGIQLIISLCHSLTADTNQTRPINDRDHDHVLEHSLHQLLRGVHFKYLNRPYSHPASAPLGLDPKRVLAGPTAMDRDTLDEISTKKSILDQIIEQAQHIFMRKRTQYVLDTLARDVKDPQIVSHWNAMISPTLSCVKINIVTHGYDTINRTSLVIHVKERSLKCICRDGRVMDLSYEPQELRDLILCQINSHQISCLLNLARCMAWTVLSNSNHLGIGKVEPLGNASSCLLASPNGDRMIAVSIRCDPQIDVKVYVAKSPRSDFFPNPLVQDRFWENLGGNFTEVRFDKIEGKSFLNRMEFLMSSLVSSPA